MLFFIQPAVSPSDVNYSSKVTIKVYDNVDPDKEELSLIGEAEVDVTYVFKFPYQDESLCFTLLACVCCCRI